MAYKLNKPAYAVGTPKVNADVQTLSTKFNLSIGCDDDTKGKMEFEDTTMPEVVTPLTATIAEVVAAGIAAGTSYLNTNWNN